MGNTMGNTTGIETGLSVSRSTRPIRCHGSNKLEHIARGWQNKSLAISAIIAISLTCAGAREPVFQRTLNNNGSLPTGVRSQDWDE